MQPHTHCRPLKRFVIGFNLAVNDIRADGHLDDDTSFDVVIRHIDYLINRLGEDKVALGILTVPSFPIRSRMRAACHISSRLCAKVGLTS